MFRLSIWFAALSLTVACVYGNAPPPDIGPRVVEPTLKPTPGISVPVDVSYVKPNGNPTAKIVIPLATLKALAETAKVNQSITMPLGVANPSEPTSGFPHGGTIIAGIAISLAMVSMVYLLRRRPTHKWAVTGTAVALIGISVTSYLWADVSIPGQPYKGPTRRPDNQVRPIPNQQPMVTIEIADKGDTILVIVPPSGQ